MAGNVVVMALANSIPDGVGARWYRSFRTTRLHRRLHIAAISLLSLHWLTVTLMMVLKVHGWMATSTLIPTGPVLTLLAWSAFIYIISLPLAMPILAAVWIRLVKTATAAHAISRRAIPIGVALYGLHAAYFVPFMSNFD